MEISVKELADLIRSAPSVGRSHSMCVGDKVFIRTVTMHFTGQIEAVTDTDIVLSDAAWVADSGRFSAALGSGTLAEVEPYPHGVIVQRDSIVDISPWKHALPQEVK